MKGGEFLYFPEIVSKNYLNDVEELKGRLLGEMSITELWIDGMNRFIEIDCKLFNEEELKCLVDFLYESILSDYDLSLVKRMVALYRVIMKRYGNLVKNTLEWKPIYRKIYEKGISNSKIKPSVFPPDYLESLVDFAIICKDFYPSHVVQEVIDNFLSLLVSGKQCLGFCLICMFFPAQYGFPAGLFEKMFKLYCLWNSTQFDCLFLCFLLPYIRVYGLDSLETQLVQKIFTKISLLIGLPLSNLEIEKPVHHCSVCSVLGFIFGTQSQFEDLIGLYSQALSILMKTNYLTPVLVNLQKFFDLVEPVFSPIPYVDTNNVKECSSIFIQSLLNTCYSIFCNDKSLCDDIRISICSSFLPIVFLGILNGNFDPMLIFKIVKLSPQSLSYVFEYINKYIESTKYRSKLIPVLKALIPFISETNESNEDLLLHLTIFVNDISFLDIEITSLVFDLYIEFFRFFQIEDSLADWAITLFSKCMTFASVAECAQNPGIVYKMSDMLVSLMRASDEEIKKKALEVFFENYSHISKNFLLPFYNSLVPLENYDIDIFSEISEAKCIIIRSQIEFSTTFFPNHQQEIVNYLIDSLFHEERMIRKLSRKAIGSLINVLLGIRPIFSKDIENPRPFSLKMIKWYIPSDNGIQIFKHFLSILLPRLKTQFISKNYDLQIQTMEIVICIFKHISLNYRSYSDEKKVLSYHLINRMPNLSIIDCLVCDILDWLVTLLDYQTNASIQKLVLEAINILYISPKNAYKVNRKYDYSLPIISQLSSDYMNDISFNIYKRKYLEYFWHVTEPLPSIFIKYLNKIIGKIDNLDWISSEVLGIIISNSVSYYPICRLPVISQIITRFIRSNEHQNRGCISQILKRVLKYSIPEEMMTLFVDLALSLCIEIPNDFLKDTINEIRLIVISILDNMNFFSEKLNSKHVQEERIRLIVEAINSSLQFENSSEVNNVSAALIFSVIEGKNPVINVILFEYLLKCLNSDEFSIRSLACQLLTWLIELLIPRSSSQLDVKMPFKGFLKDIVKNTFCMSYEQSQDVSFLTEFFIDPENRVIIHQFLYDEILNNDLFFVYLYNRIIEEWDERGGCFSHDRFIFLRSLVRFFGPSIMLKLFQFAINLLCDYPSQSKIILSIEIFCIYLYHYVIFCDEKCVFDMYFIELFSLILKSVDTFDVIIPFELLPNKNIDTYKWIYEHSCEQLLKDQELNSGCILLYEIIAYFVPNDYEELVSILTLLSNGSKFQNVSRYELTSSYIKVLSLLITKIIQGNYISENYIKLKQYIFQLISKSSLLFVFEWINQVSQERSIQTAFCYEIIIENIVFFFNIFNETNILPGDEIGCLSMFNSIGQQFSFGDNKGFKQLLTENGLFNAETPIHPSMFSFLTAFLHSSVFLIDGNVINDVILDLVCQALLSDNIETQDSASLFLAYLFRSFSSTKDKIPVYCEVFTKMLDEDDKQKFAGMKGLFSIVWASVLFDEIPEYILSIFTILMEISETVSLLSDPINRFFYDFWSSHESKLTMNATVSLSPFKDSLKDVIMNEGM